MEWIASTAFGLEGLAAAELRGLNIANVRPLDTAGVRFSGEPIDALRANLYLRTADRVMLVCAQGNVRSFEELFQLASRTRWEQWLPKDARFPVRAHCARSQLMSPSDCQSIVKKAVAQRMANVYKTNWLPESGAVYQIDVSIRKDEAFICLDTSGEALNRRGYRTWNGEAPLRETLAAALLEISPWRPGIALVDPMCGTGTIAIEAALMANGRAPGLLRSFAMENWAMLPRAAAEAIRSDAQDLFSRTIPPRAPICASDIDPAQLELAKRHAKQSGMDRAISLRLCDARTVTLPAERGVIVTNPPYGERMGDQSTALQAAAILGELWRANPGWTVCALSSASGFERAFGRHAQKRRRFYNGRIECEFMIFPCQNLSSRNGGKRT